MQDEFKELRAALYSSEEELKRFRQLVVNTVLATDIADKELQALRKNRWNDTFDESGKVESDSESEINRKATIVLEHIIQAADVSHCMQHWHTYTRWNQRLFEECYVAWMNDHAAKSPGGGWYKGEMWFFDNYIIPLAEKLKKCGVFGVSYHENYCYAIENRKEWEQKGERIVAQMLEECERKFGTKKSYPTLDG
jgi:hypothetical protein